MKIGVPKETKNGEYRVGLTPESVAVLVQSGHEVLVETEASAKIGISDDDYIDAGALIAANASDVFQWADMIVKVKEPSLSEASQFKSNQIIFCYLHLAPNPALTKLLLERNVIGVAFETITSRDGYPLLCPMSIVAGRMATQVGANLLECSHGGRGVLMSGVPGYGSGAKVVILGGGVVGSNAAEVAVGMGADVTIFDNNSSKLSQLDQRFSTLKAIDNGTGNPSFDMVSKIKTCMIQDKALLESELSNADVAIGAVHVAGALTSRLVSEELVKKMKRGSVIVDVAIDQGGCFETAHPTSHAEPTYVMHGVTHYCVPNMPGSVPVTSTYALNTFLLPFAKTIADLGIVQACKDSKDIRDGVHIWNGNITNKYIADSVNSEMVDIMKFVE